MIERINTVIFQREKGSEWEMGLQFNNGDLGIVDATGNKVEQIWDCKEWRGLDIETRVFEDFQGLVRKK